MNTHNLFERATSPDQYDNPDLFWETNASADTPRASFIWEYLQPYSSGWAGKDILDIGAGSAWLLDKISKAGANTVTGVEPSVRNVEICKKLFPEIKVMLSSLEDFDPQAQKFNVVISVLVFSHIRDLDFSFQKVSDMLKPQGEFFCIIPDFDYFKMPRHGYEIEQEYLNENEYVVSVKRAFGTIVDVVRTNEVYEIAGKMSGMTLTETIPMLPTDRYISQLPKFERFRNQPIEQLLRFSLK